MLKSRLSRSVEIAAVTLLFVFPTVLWSEPPPALGYDSLSATLACDRTPDESAPFMADRRLLVESLDSVGQGDIDALVRIYCTVPRWRVDEKIFFKHPSVRNLSLDDRNSLHRVLASIDPIKLIEISQGGEAVEPAFLRIAAQKQTRRVVAKVSRMSPDAQLGALLQEIPAIELMSRREQRKLSLQRRVRALADDPAIEANYSRIENSWFTSLVDEDPIAASWTSVSDLVQDKTLVARNLFFRNLPVTQDEFGREIRRIRSARDQIGQYRLFSDRRTLYLGDGQQWPSGKPIFGAARDLVKLESQGSRVRFVSDVESASDTAEMVNDEIRHTPQLTVLLGAHGRESGLDLGSGIAVKALAQSFVIRAGLQGEGAEPVLLVVMSCEAHNFVRRLLDSMHRQDPSAQKPVVIVPAEYGQAFLKYPGDRFLSGDLGLRTEESSTLGAVFEDAQIETSVYVPDENNVPMQVL